jgi:hypothetical protein
MKNQFKIIRISMITLGLSLLMLFKANAQVGIGTSSPEASAKLEITSATKGFLLPRMTGNQRDAIVSPVAGLKIWCIDCGSTVPYGEAQIYNGAIWTNLVGGTIKSVIVPGTNTITGATSPIGIGTNSPNSSAMLDITSNTQGFLPPRMTAAQRDAIVSPVAGLEIWCIDCGATAPYGEAQIYNGAIWTNLEGGTIKSVTVAGTNTSGGAISPIGIGTNTPAASAALDVNSTSKGFLIPRMTSTERNRMEPASTAAGLQVWCSDCNAGAGELSIYNGEQWTTSSGTIANATPPTGGNAICDGTRPTVVKEVVTTTGKIWMDRNLGASRAATSSNDYFSYGCKYQWGRGNDGHASINYTSSTAGTSVNGTTTTLSSGDVPGNAQFIRGNTSASAYGSSPNPDWRTSANDNLWQGINGINNPCPAGFRVPTQTEIVNELNTNLDFNGTSYYYSISSAFSNILKLPASGDRYMSNNTNELISNLNSLTRLWTSSINSGTTVNGQARMLEAGSNYGFTNNMTRSWGLAVRCIKN